MAISKTRRGVGDHAVHVIKLGNWELEDQFKYLKVLGVHVMPEQDTDSGRETVSSYNYCIAAYLENACAVPLSPNTKIYSIASQF